MKTRKTMYTRAEARKVAINEGINFSKDYHQLSSTEVDKLLSIKKFTTYHKPASASGSTARYFFYYLQKA